ncbi:MAG: hypothetical protein EXS16_11445 [Gemmataceae bacterium]|nr:hypothetical protein [Gemmataceae bacterium]
MSHRFLIGVSASRGAAGIDAALVQVDGVGANASLQLKHHTHMPHGRELRELIHRATTDPTPELRHLATLHRVLGESYALAVKQLLDQARVTPSLLACIGCSAQPLWHDGDGKYPTTLSLGMPDVLAERTGLTVVTDFASKDLAVGGSGVPLEAFVDAHHLRGADESRAVLHLGSIASLVYLPSRRATQNRAVLGFHASPGTMLLDGLMRLLTNGKEACDIGGKYAVQGRCIEPLVERWLQNHYLQKPVPKCLPVGEFGSDFLNRAIQQANREGGKLHDVLCTMTHFIAQAIVDAIERLLPDRPERIYVTGRGTRNGLLWHLLEQKLQPTPMQHTDALGIPAESYKAFAAAALASLTLDGVAANIITITGASGLRVLGSIVPGSPANWARCLAWMARCASQPQAAAA